MRSSSKLPLALWAIKPRRSASRVHHWAPWFTSLLVTLHRVVVQRACDGREMGQGGRVQPARVPRAADRHAHAEQVGPLRSAPGAPGAAAGSGARCVARTRLVLAGTRMPCVDSARKGAASAAPPLSTRLRTLNLCDNALRHVPAALCLSAPQLHHLHLRANELDALPAEVSTSACYVCAHGM